MCVWYICIYTVYIGYIWIFYISIVHTANWIQLVAEKMLPYATTVEETISICHPPFVHHFLGSRGIGIKAGAANREERMGHEVRRIHLLGNAGIKHFKGLNG